MAAAFLFTAPVALLPALSIPPASAYTLGLRRFSSQRYTSHHEDISNVVADSDRTIPTNDVPVIIVSSATLTSIHESPAVNTLASSSPRSSIISAFTTSSATSSSSSRTSVTTSIRKTMSRLSRRSSSSSPKRSMAQDMDMDFCCRGPPKKIYEDLDMDFCCRGEAYDEDDSTAAEDLVEGSTDAPTADPQAAPAPLAASTAHNIITRADATSALPQINSVITSSEVTSSDDSPRFSSPCPHGNTSAPTTASSCTTSPGSSSLEAIKATNLTPPRTMRCAVGT